MTIVYVKNAVLLLKVPSSYDDHFGANLVNDNLRQG